MSDRQQALGITDTSPVDSVEEYQFEPIKGYPMLQWRGKRPFTSTRYYPAQRKEVHGAAVDGWRNKIYWGDNLQVMSHLLKEYRGQVQLVYIDPPFDSGADYRKSIRFQGEKADNDQNIFEEMQYTDIWTNDEYLQFMYERITVLREILSDEGSLWLHCDPNRSHYLKIIIDEIFGADNFVNEISWKRSGAKGLTSNQFPDSHDTILYYAKKRSLHNWQKVYGDYSEEYVAKYRYVEDGSGRRYMMDNLQNPNPNRPNLTYEWNGHIRCWRWTRERMTEMDAMGRIVYAQTGMPYYKRYLDEGKGQIITDTWIDISPINSQAHEREGYPTQKPEQLVERVLLSASNPGDLVFDCFMGSGTTQAVAMKLGRRFIGADINLGAVQITTKRLITVAKDIAEQQTKAEQASQQTLLSTDQESEDDEDASTEQTPTIFYTGFEVYNVNHYDVFRNPVEAKELLIEALEMQRLPAGHLFDGEKDGRMWKIMPVNRIATRADLNELVSGLDYRAFERRFAEHPHQPVERITLVCMGHEADLASQLKSQVSPYVLDVEVVDILRDRSDLQFKRDAEARIAANNGHLVIERFYPMNLLQKLSLPQEQVEDWRELVESVMVDWNYDGAALEPAVVDVPGKNELVAGRYAIPDTAGTIRVKITDLLSESLEVEVAYG